MDAPRCAARRNRVRYAGNGILLERSTGDRVRENTAIDNTLDCSDASTGGSSAPPSHGTLNTWVGNVGATSSPVGICSPAAP